MIRHRCCLTIQNRLAAAALSFASLLLAGTAAAQESASNVQTPDLGHVAGQPVVIVARGFAPGEPVELQVIHAGGTAEPGMGHDPWTVIAGADGTFATTWVINPPDVGSDEFSVVARGQFSGVSSSATFDRMAAVSTDKFGYAPAEDATIVGTGFLAGEGVTLQVLRSGAATDADVCADPWTATADAAGNIASSWHVSSGDSLAADSILTAQGTSSGLVAAWAFTDSTCQNPPAPDPVSAYALPSAACPTNLGSCSANDVVTTVVAAHALDGGICGSRNDTLDLSFTLKFETTANQRYDLGAFFAEDGGSLVAGSGSRTAQVCGGAAPQVGWGDGNADSGDCDSDLFLDLDPTGHSAAGNAVDTCGDLQSTAGPVFWTVTATVSCATVDSNFHLKVPSCRVWEQNANHQVACTSLSQAGTGSKCDCSDLDFTAVLDPCVTALCDDGNICTSDSCAVESGVAACHHDPVADGTSCDFGTVCGGQALCSSGACASQIALNCDDNNPCTDDSCDEATGCVHVNNSQSCNDGDACTTGDTCGGGSCQPGTAVVCNDNNGCTTDSCDPATGCVYTNNTDACDDGNACTAGDTCGGGSCQPGTAVVCNDNNGCTDDSCNPATGCVYTNNTNACDDGNACTTGDTCGGGLCKPGTAVVCNDNNGCTDDSCNPATGCVYTNNTNSCDDGNACTTGDTCGGGSCQPGTAVVCNDNNGCTTDSCDPAAGCVYTNNTNPCDDGNACTTGDTCGGGSCQPGSAVVCNDNNGCTTDSCNPAKGCVYTNNTNPCDDGNACTTGDTCGGGSCQPGTAVVCNDNNGCTDDSCNPATGCVYTNNSNPCDDGNACTTGDTCGGGSCQPGTAVVCNDNNGCTDDSCNPATGCVYTNNTNACDDGNACTTGDTCGGGSCQPGTAVVCNDNNGCTTDSCNPAKGCVYTNNSNSCDDGNACTTGDTCGGGSCQPGTAIVCNDSNGCTTDSCDPATGCVYTNNTNACSDGNACTAGDTCGGGSCRPGTAVVCNDSNGCTTDSCDPAKGCVYTNNTNSCDDGNACTTGDTCGGGRCNAGGPTNCDDGNCCTTDSCDPATGCAHAANTTGPVFTTQPSLGNTILWPPNHAYADFAVSDFGAAAVTSCGVATIRFASCSSSQPENGTSVGDGNTTRDCVFEPGALHLRAERDGTCSPIGRVYETTLVAVDSCGNYTVSNPIDIGVWHDRRNPPAAGDIVRASHGNPHDPRAGTNGTYGPGCGPGSAHANGSVRDRSDDDPEMEISQEASVSVDNLRVNKTSSGTLTLTWTAPAQGAGSPITKYHVYRRNPGSLFWVQVAEVTTQTNSYPDPVLSDGVAWQYKVTAVIK